MTPDPTRTRAMTSFPRSAFRLRPTVQALVLLALVARSAVAAPVPDAGTILQQVRPPEVPAPEPKAPSLTLDRAPQAGLPSSAPFQVNVVRITGNTAFDTATLHALVKGLEGGKRTLQDLGEGAAAITAYYQSGGFPLARAIVPAQSVKDGEVLIQVVEARHGEVRLNNSSDVGDALMRAVLAPLRPGDPISEKALDRALLLLSDLPEVAVSSVIGPGAEVGTSDLAVDASRGAGPRGNVSLDNFGDRYTGRARLSGAGVLVNPFHRGDTFSVGGTTSGRGLNYVRAAYDTWLTGQGTRAGLAYSAVRYKLGDSLASADAHGSAGVASVWVRHPLVRSRTFNLNAQVQFDAKVLKDRLGAGDVRTDRHLHNWIVDVSGDVRDPLFAGGSTAWSLGWTSGRVRFDDAVAEAGDAATAGSRGSFSKWNANVSREQALGGRGSLFASLSGQWADSNLDSAEKMSVGGPYAVRAYDTGAVSGDAGYAATVEYRHDLGDWAGGQAQAVAFVDGAHVRVNQRPWVTGVNSANLAGAGLGVNWVDTSGWKVGASVASRVGPVPTLVGKTASARGWVVLSRSF